MSDTSITIQIEYYAIFRAIAKKTGEMLTMPTCSVIDLYEDLKLRYQFPLERRNVLVALNDSYADWSTPLKNGDKLVFLPPMAGG